MLSTPVALALLIGVASIVLYWLRERRGPTPPVGLTLPPLAPGFPFLGSGHRMGSDPYGFVTEQWKKHGEIFSCIAMGARLTFLVGPDAHNIFMSHGDDDLNQEEPYRFSVPIFGNGVIYDCPPHIRNQQLRLISKSLDPAHLKSYVPQIVQETEDYFARWGNEGTVDIREALGELIILTAARTLMGEEVRATMHDKIAELYKTLDEGLSPLSVMFPYLPIPRHARRDGAREEMVRLFTKIVAERKKHPEVHHDDVLQVFMDARYRPEEGETEGRALTMVEVAGLMIALLFAGQHTSSVTGSWVGLRMLRDAELVKRVNAEQVDVMSSKAGLDFESLQSMDLLHRCVKEALRLGPPLIFVMRKTLRDFSFKEKYWIPKDDVLFVCTMLSMRDPAVFPDPEKYDPDRYIPSRAEDAKKDFSFVGFGGGRHACMGQNFAYLQLKAIWSTLLRNFEMETVGPLPEPDFHAMVVGPTSPCLIKYRRRKLI